MTSLYAKYLAEKSNRHILEDSYGFITYEIVGDICYVWDLFIVPEERGKGMGFELASDVLKIAKNKGCVAMMGCVDLTMKQPSKSLTSLLRMGMEVSSCKENFIYLKKDI